MRLRRLSTDRGAKANWLLVAIIAILVVSSSSVGFILMTQGNAHSDTARVGDRVKVDYIGMLEDGRVFDTSLWSVTSDNGTYPKSLTFTYKNESSHKPLEFQVGGGTMIRGFDAGVVGMKVGETKTIVIPPAEGYGNADPKKMVNITLNATAPIYDWMTTAEYNAKYGRQPAMFLTVTDPIYGWGVQVEALPGNGSVLVRHLAAAGEEYDVFGRSADSTNVGWKLRAWSVDQDGDGLIRYEYLLDEEDARELKGVYKTKVGTKTLENFILESVDKAENKAVLHYSDPQAFYNPELRGVTLTFTVTLLAVTG